VIALLVMEKMMIVRFEFIAGLNYPGRGPCSEKPLETKKSAFADELKELLRLTCFGLERLSEGINEVSGRII
jgi:hypothetical protein